jgi:uncharacterized DUF497 family protein
MPAPPYSDREFEWDERKNARNLAKHGISFEEAVEVFDGSLLLKVDDRREYGEKRIKALGTTGGDIWHVVYTERGSRIRIIPQGRRVVKKDEHIVRYTRETVPKGRTDWERLRRVTDEEIEQAARSDPDAPPTDFEYWQDARVVPPRETERVTLRLDREVLDFFRRQGRGYQSRMNAVLQAYVEAQRRKAG